MSPRGGNVRARNIRQLTSWRQPNALPDSQAEQVKDKASLAGSAKAKAKAETKGKGKEKGKAKVEPKAKAPASGDPPVKRERLSQEEISRRASEGRCTYCCDKDHVRSSCIVGRIIRGVPRTELRRRIHAGICPVCGDPEKDGHTKKQCPMKQKTEQELFNKNLQCTKGASLQKWAKEDSVQVFKEKEAKRKAARKAVAAVAEATQKKADKVEKDEWMRTSDSSDSSSTSGSTKVVTPPSVEMLAKMLAETLVLVEDLIDKHSN